jgi:hypothetical protein
MEMFVEIPVDPSGRRTEPEHFGVVELFEISRLEACEDDGIPAEFGKPILAVVVARPYSAIANLKGLWR